MRMRKYLFALALLVLPLIVFADAGIIEEISGGAPGVSSGNIGVTTTSGASDVFRSQGYVHSKFTTGTAGTVSYAHLRVSDGNSEPVSVQIWDMDGIELLSCATTLSDGADGWENISCGGSYELVAATDYYLGVNITDAGGDFNNYYQWYSGPEIWEDDQAGAASGSNLVVKEEAQHTNNAKIVIYFDNSSGDPS